MTITSAFPIGYFYIVSKASGLVVDIEHDPSKESGEIPGVCSKIVMATKKETSPERDSQLWIHQDGFLTSKETGLVLNINRSTSFTAIFTGEEHLYLGKMKEEEKAKDQRFGFDAEKGHIYALHDSNIVVDIRKGDTAENGRVMVNKLKADGSDVACQQWEVLPGDEEHIDSSDEEEDEGKRQRLRAWFGKWTGWGSKKKEVLHEKELSEAYNKVYQKDTKKNKAHLSHELLAGAVAFAAVQEWERKREESGEPVNHATAKKIIASLITAELVKHYEERGNDEEDKPVAQKTSLKNSLLQHMATSAALNYFESKYGH